MLRCSFLENACFFTYPIAAELQSSFFAHFMCFEVPALVPPGGLVNGNKSVPTDDENDDDLGIMDIDENDNDGKLSSSIFALDHLTTFITSRLCNFSGKRSADLQALNESLHDLLDGIQVFSECKLNI